MISGRKDAGLAFNGRSVMMVERGRPLRLWDARTGAAVRTYIGHARAVSAVAFAPSGDRLASGGAKGP